ncbi:MAG TPA: hypothetical protein VLI90_11775, partial [Tepidisphaeraceae bacterium]|nr:hypothetical protein [Tepidisphaeraceae bacterium]
IRRFPILSAMADTPGQTDKEWPCIEVLHHPPPQMGSFERGNRCAIAASILPSYRNMRNVEDSIGGRVAGGSRR